jgi:ferrous iron transport protein B
VKKKEGTGHNKKKPGFVIVGNMNVGKTTLFSRMCGTDNKSINVSGSTVSITKGRIRGTDRVVFDTPGIFSIFSTNEDERASRDILLPMEPGYDIQEIILVADAKNIKRSIAIALQYAEYGLPMLLDINMIDEAVSRGIEIDYEKLSEILGIDVCTTVARKGIGV